MPSLKIFSNHQRKLFGLWPKQGVFHWLYVFLFNAMALSVYGQEQFFDSWQVKDGLPQNSVKTIIQTPDGYIWLATEGGLARFDGREFTTYNVENTPELPSNRITCLFAASNGTLFIGTYKGGLTVMQEKQFFNRTDVLGGQPYSIREIVEDEQGGLWLSNTENDIIHILDPDTYESRQIVKVVDKRTMVTTFMQNGVIYFPSRESIELYDYNMQALSGTNEVYPENEIECIVKDPDQNIYWIIDNGYLKKLSRDKELGRYKIPERQKYSKYVIRFHHVGNKIYTSFYGNSEMVVFDIPSEEFSVFDVGGICKNGAINDIIADTEENIWMATDICGLIKLKPPRFSYLGTANQTIDENIYPIKRDSIGRILIGTRLADMLILDMEKGTITKPDSLLAEVSHITSIESYKGGIYYAAVTSDHLLEWRGSQVKKLYFPNGNSQQTNAIYATKGGDLLVGTGQQLYKLEGDQLIFHPLGQRMYLKNVANFYEDRQGYLWIVNDRTVICYDEKLDSVRFNSGNFITAQRFYRGINGDADGNIFVGSYGFGLHIIRDGEMHTINKSHGLAESVVSTITEDKIGNLWLTGNMGLSRISKSELFEVIEGKRDKFNTVFYNEQTDGLRTGEFNGGNQQDKCWLDGERYAFPTIKGAVVVDFANMRFNSIPPPVHIQKLAYADTVVPANENVSVPYSDNRMDIYFTALSFVSPQNVRFRYKMEGYENEWINAGTERKTSYSKLPPGAYTFRVIACNNEGIWNVEGASVQITIVPPYYMTWWFRIGIIVLVLMLTILLVWQIVAQNRKRERQKSALMDLLPDLVFKIDQNGNYLDIYGKPSDFPEPLENFDHRKISDFLPERISEAARLKISKAIETGEMQDYAYKLTQADGSVRYFESRFIAIDRKEVLCIIRDITKPRLAEKRIRSSERKLLEALETEKKLLKRITKQQKLQLEAIVNTEENERKRIAKDLHDGIGQLLSSVKINLGVARSRIDRKDYDATAAMVDKSKLTIDQITNELRNISYNLLPPSLEQFGLASAIEEEVNRLKSKPNLFIHFDNATQSIKFDQKVEIVLFRVFQEMLNNAIKHSNASEITIQLIEHKKTLVLMLEDDGSGFDIEAGLLKKDSSGLKNLYSRIDLIKGKINIDSAPTSGTTITIEIPL